MYGEDQRLPLNQIYVFSSSLADTKANIKKGALEEGTVGGESRAESQCPLDCPRGLTSPRKGEGVIDTPLLGLCIESPQNRAV